MHEITTGIYPNFSDTGTDFGKVLRIKPRALQTQGEEHARRNDFLIFGESGQDLTCTIIESMIQRLRIKNPVLIGNFSLGVTRPLPTELCSLTSLR